MNPYDIVNLPINDEQREVAAIAPIKFETRYVEREFRDGPMNNPIKRVVAEDWVEWAKRGVAIPCTVPMSIRAAKGAPAIWNAIKDAYENWKQNGGGGELILSGKPLNAVQNFPKELIEALRAYRIHTVEDLSMMSDDVLSKIPDPRMLNLRSWAKGFLQVKDISEATAKADKAQEQVAELKAQLEQMQKALAKKEQAEGEAAEAKKPKRQKPEPRLSEAM